MHKMRLSLAVGLVVSAATAGWGQCVGRHGDVSGDGEVSNLDALMVQSYFLGKLACFPVDADQDGWWPEEFCTPTGTPTPTVALSPTPTNTSAAPPPDLTITLPGGVTMEFVLCSAGSFQMGSMDGSDWSWCYPCEQPVHTVTFARGFYMGKYEVTQGQWQAIMGSNPSSFKSCGSTCPVETVSWNDCQTFIANLNNHVTSTGQGPATLRLPSEAEWEYACRAGTTTRFSFGDSTCQPADCNPCDLSNYAWWCGNNSPNGTKPVGGKLPNPWGLYDMHGNVWERCQDWWHSSYNGAPTDGSAWEDGDSTYRVIRGGDWVTNAHYCRSSYRFGHYPSNLSNDLGLRLSRSVAP